MQVTINSSSSSNNSSSSSSSNKSGNSSQRRKSELGDRYGEIGISAVAAAIRCRGEERSVKRAPSLQPESD